MANNVEDRPHWTLRSTDSTTHRHLHFLGMKFLLLQVLPKNLSVVHLLLVCKLTKGVAAYRVVTLGHSQRASTLAGHAGEALSPGEVVYSHLVKADILPP